MTNKILANVGGFPITESEVDEFLRGLGQRGQAYNTPEGRSAILNQLIGNKLLLLDARRNLLEGEAAFREQLAKLKDQLLINYSAEKTLSAVTVSDDEAKTYYEENKNSFVGGETVSASHILVSDEALCKELIKKIESGEISFEDAARENSSCPSKELGGSLGEFERGMMVPEFDAAVFSMQVGELSKEPVKTQFGYHVIRLDAKNEPKALPYEEISAQIKGQLLAEKQRKAYESKINQLKIVYPVDIMA